MTLTAYVSGTDIDSSLIYKQLQTFSPIFLSHICIIKLTLDSN